jgi:hypothetical protein
MSQTEAEMTAAQRAERDRQLATAATLNDAQVAERQRVADAAYARAVATHGRH